MPTMSEADGVLRELLLQQLWFDGDTRLTATAEGLASADPSVDSGGGATRVLLAALARTWEQGWQPADVVHMIRRDGSPHGLRLTLALIAEDARLTAASSRAPVGWLDQLDTLGVLREDAPRGVHVWHVAEQRSPEQAWREVLLLAGRLRLLFPVPELLPPPSRWGAATPPPHSAPGRAPARSDDRVLRRVRGLLAKAESTEFPEEADALTAKAQELMSTHALDTALLDTAGDTAARDGVRSRRLHVDEPYVQAKMALLSQVGEANGVRTVWYRASGIATVVGMPVDLETVELLFTSLLVQAARAMTAAGTAGGAHARSAAFRRSFLLSYAGRIGERLADARSRATAETAASAGVDALPVLRSRQQAVDEVYQELFPGVRGRRSRAFDAAGWMSGRRAADAADLPGRRGRLSR
jgi:hypothetical protein